MKSLAVASWIPSRSLRTLNRVHSSLPGALPSAQESAHRSFLSRFQPPNASREFCVETDAARRGPKRQCVAGLNLPSHGRARAVGLGRQVLLTNHARPLHAMLTGNLETPDESPESARYPYSSMLDQTSENTRRLKIYAAHLPLRNGRRSSFPLPDHPREHIVQMRGVVWWGPGFPSPSEGMGHGRPGEHPGPAEGGGPEPWPLLCYATPSVSPGYSRWGEETT